MLSKMALLGGLAAVAMAGSAHAGLLYSNDFDGAELRGTGVSGAFSGLPTEAAAAGFWNAAGWAGNYGASRGGLIDGAVADFTGLSLTGLATHTHINASFILGFLESWDSTDGSFPFSPDHLEVYIDGSKVADLTYNNALGSIQMTGGVPEPASWALMIAGFGLSGAALRHRRAAVAG